MRENEGDIAGSIMGKFIGGSIGLAAAIGAGIELDKLLQSIPQLIWHKTLESFSM